MTMETTTLFSFYRKKGIPQVWRSQYRYSFTTEEEIDGKEILHRTRYKGNS